MIKNSTIRAIIEAEELARENRYYSNLAGERKQICGDCEAEMNYIRSWPDKWVSEYYCPKCKSLKVLWD